MSKEIKIDALMNSFDKFLKQCDVVEAEFKSYPQKQKLTSVTETVEERLARKKQRTVPAEPTPKMLNLRK